jgi:putative ABC transport system permease protein
MVQNTRPAILMLWAGVSLLMLIAAANIANLLLMHGCARSRELSIRIALGAGRWRIVQQLAIESVLLTCAGGVLGTCLGAWSVPALRAALPGSIPLSVQKSARDLFGACVSLMAAITVFRLPCAARDTRSTCVPVQAGRSPRSRSVLVTMEVTLTVMLLAGRASATVCGRSSTSIGLQRPMS